MAKNYFSIGGRVRSYADRDDDPVEMPEHIIFNDTFPQQTLDAYQKACALRDSIAARTKRACALAVWRRPECLAACVPEIGTWPEEPA